MTTTLPLAPRPLAPQPSPLTEAIRQELKTILDRETLGIAELHRIGRIAERSKQLLQAFAPGEGRSKATASYQTDSSFDDQVDESQQVQNTVVANMMTMAPSPPAETYGATILREFMGVVVQYLESQKRPPTPDAQESPRDVVDAIVEANRQGEAGVAAALRDRLIKLPHVEVARAAAEALRAVGEAKERGEHAVAAKLEARIVVLLDPLPHEERVDGVAVPEAGILPCRVCKTEQQASWVPA